MYEMSIGGLPFVLSMVIFLVSFGISISFTSADEKKLVFSVVRASEFGMIVTIMALPIETVIWYV